MQIVVVIGYQRSQVRPRMNSQAIHPITCTVSRQSSGRRFAGVPRFRYSVVDQLNGAQKIIRERRERENNGTLVVAIIST